MSVPVFNSHGMTIQYPDTTQKHDSLWAIFKEMFEYKDYDMLDLKGKVVLDVGAYCGETAIFFSRRGAHWVYCLEPFLSCDYIATNCKNNGVRNVTAIRGAIAPVTGELRIDPNFRNNGGTRSDAPETKGGHSIMAYSLKDFMDRVAEIEHLEENTGWVLKLDTEGAEYGVLMTAPEGVLRVFDQMVIEYHSGDEDAQRIVERLGSFGFDVHVKHCPNYPQNKLVGLIYAKTD